MHKYEQIFYALFPSKCGRRLNSVREFESLHLRQNGASVWMLHFYINIYFLAEMFGLMYHKAKVCLYIERQVKRWQFQSTMKCTECFWTVWPTCSHTGAKKCAIRLQPACLSVRQNGRNCFRAGGRLFLIIALAGLVPT